MIGAMLSAGTVAAIATTAVVLAAQVARINFEEQLLRSVFPDYDEQFRGIAHLLTKLPRASVSALHIRRAASEQFATHLKPRSRATMEPSSAAA